MVFTNKRNDYSIFHFGGMSKSEAAMQKKSEELCLWQKIKNYSDEKYVCGFDWVKKLLKREKPKKDLKSTMKTRMIAYKKRSRKKKKTKTKQNLKIKKKQSILTYVWRRLKN